MSSMLEAAPDGRASVARLQEAMRQLVQQLRHLVTSHPLTARAGEALERAVARAYARLLPVLAELSRNSLLAGGLGLAVGLAIVISMFRNRDSVDIEDVSLLRW